MWNPDDKEEGLEKISIPTPNASKKDLFITDVLLHPEKYHFVRNSDSSYSLPNPKLVREFDDEKKTWLREFYKEYCKPVPTSKQITSQLRAELDDLYRRIDKQRREYETKRAAWASRTLGKHNRQGDGETKEAEGAEVIDDNHGQGVS